jgi:hypothetical protein
MDAHDQAKLLGEALRAVEPKLEIRQTSDPTDFSVMTVVVLDGVRMRIHSDYYDAAADDAEHLAQYARRVVEHLRKEGKK